MRRQGASIFIYAIFGILIAVFVINFGPQRGNRNSGDVGCTGTTNQTITVDGSVPSVSAYHIAYANPYNQGKGKQRTWVALESLITRELLANEADTRNLMVTDDLIQDEIKQGYFFIAGHRLQPPSLFEIIDGEKYVTANRYRSWLSQFNVSKNAYIEEQKRSLQATMMAEILTSSVQVSRDEALSRFLFENNTITYDVVAFQPDTYRAAMKLSDADVARFLSTHEDEVQARYKTDERTYKGVKPQLQLRQIFIAKLEPPKPEAPAPDDKKADDKKADDKKADDKTAKADKKADKKEPAVKPVGMPIDEAKAKLEAARTAITAGKQKFADAAKELDTDEAAKLTGGDLGWRTADNPALAEKAVSDAVKTLKPGEMTPVITTDRGAYLVMAEAKREGDLSFDQVKHDIAKDLARDTWSKEAAKRAALAALDIAKTGMIKDLDKLYEHDAAPEQPNIDIEKILNDPNMSDEEKNQILQMLLQRQQKHGSITIETKDQPAAWYAEGDDKGAGGPAAPAPGSPAPPAGSPAPGSPAPGSAAQPAGSAAPGSAAQPPAGSGAVPTPAPPAPAPAVEVIASKDQLPAFGDVPKAKVHRFGPAPHSSELPGVGKSKEAVNALFDELQQGDLAKHAYDADGAYVIVQLVARTTPNVADFDKEADQRVAELRAKRGQEFLDTWLKDKCETAYKEGRIRPNAELIQERDDKGNPLPVQYRPCMSFR